MRVLLVRHGEAVDTRTAFSDYDRWLTEEGRRMVGSVGERLARMGLDYTRMLTSPLVRAVQTADILATTHPDFGGPVSVHRALASEEGTTAEALAPIDQAPDGELIVMVTHMPKIGMLAARLGGLSHPPSFTTASACLLEVEPGRGQALWMLDPTTLEVHPV